jgi:elongation factor Tu
VPDLVVFINKCDLVEDQEIIDLVEMEARELLTKYGFNGNKTPVIRGNARGALDNPADPEFRKCIEQLLDALDTYIPNPVRKADKPFLMPIEGVHKIEGRGTVVTGKIEQGTVCPNMKVEVVGLGEIRETVAVSIEAFNEVKEKGVAGENVGVLLRGVKHDEVERGQVLTQPRTVKPQTKFKCEVYVLSKEEGGRHTPLFSGYKPQFFFRTSDVTGEVKLGDEIAMAMPGENATLFVELGKPIALELGDHFAVREGGKTVGSGVITEMLE